jgi:site-specific DNA recombinase
MTTNPASGLAGWNPAAPRCAIYVRVSTARQAVSKDKQPEAREIDSGQSPDPLGRSISSLAEPTPPEPDADADRKTPQETSLDTQEAACRAYAAEHGYDVVQVFREVYTGVELWDRPQLSALREAVRRHDVDVVVAYAIDRLSRDPVHLGVLLSEADHAGVQVVFVSEPLDDSDEGQLIRFVRGYAAKVEHAKFKERSNRGRAQRAKSGKPLVGPRPLYGYRWRDKQKSGLAPNPQTAPIVQRIFTEVASGRTLGAVAAGLVADGIPSPTGLPVWFRSTLSGILQTTAYRGELRAYRFSVVGTSALALPDDVVPALVSPAVFADVAAQLQRNRQQAVRHNRAPEATLLRGGFAVCGYCGRTLHVTSHSGTASHVYRCEMVRTHRDRCAAPSVSAAVLDRAVWSKVERILLHPELLAAELTALQAADPTAADVAAIDRTLADVRRRQRNLVNRLADEDDADVASLLRDKLAELRDQAQRLDAERREVLARRAEWEAATARLAGIEAWCRGVATQLAAFTYEDKRAALTALQVKVTLYRADHTPRWVVTAKPGDQEIVSRTATSSC